MLKLRRARFTNFRLLKDVEITFSTDEHKLLTVIRAENESGKTTMLTALQWAFFGDDALDEAPGRPVRLYPIDWDAVAEPRVPVSVEVEFDYTSETSLKDGSAVRSEETFLVRRSCIENPNEDGAGSRTNNDLVLYRLEAKGDQPAANPKVELEDKFPKELRELFFTDGDRAQTWIEVGTQGVKRARVLNAIRSLLGLDLLEKAQGHVKETLNGFNRELKSIGPNTEAGTLGDRLAEIEVALDEAETAKSAATDALGRIEEQVQDYDNRIADALRQGDREELERQVRAANQQLTSAEKTELQLQRQHSDLFKDTSLALGLLAPHLRRSRELLAGLKQRGTIPQKFLPILEEAVDQGLCVCGTSLAKGTPTRKHVCDLIEEHKKVDPIVDRLTDLNVLASRISTGLDANPDGGWPERARESFGLVSGAQETLQSAQERAKELDRQLEDLPRTDVPELMKAKRSAEEERKNQIRREREAEIQIHTLERERTDLTKRRDQLLRSEKKYARLRANLRAADDIHGVLALTFAAIQHGKMKEVSDEMNRLFLQMIVANTEQAQKAIIQRAEITDDYDIVVTGPQGRRLDPDRDLNGASRRAITLSFILALTNVSGVAAPNVIDTPLGMTSGLVRQSILRTAAENATQLVLFLTPAEIRDVEDLLDEYAGTLWTMSNTAHFPSMLVNEPSSEDMRVIVCGCGHREFCEVCERNSDELNDRLVRRPA
jgi:DNA sulfur modification protein DndD